MAAWTTGAPLGPYVLIAPIGAGGMGEVWKARDTRLDRIVAVKRLKGQNSSRFEQEARAIAALNHPHICQIFDVGPDYLVLEYIEGQPLKGPLDAEEAVRLAAQIADALDAAHRKGVVHRDLKPANIMVTLDGAVKLLDFGLAKRENPSRSVGPFSTVTLAATEPGMVAGTVAYMSPEQAQGLAVDARSDIFSFGLVLYEMLSGRRAFTGDTPFATMTAIVNQETPPLQARAPLESIVKRCLEKVAAQRFQSMAAVREALGKVTQTGKAVARQLSIAVLPFANMSRDADDEYFSDGLAEEILNALAQAAGLKVISRTSAFAFKGKNEDIRKIAEALGVTNVLEGSVRRAGNRLRVTAQLIQAADGTHLWSQRYDREMTDVFAVQDEIAAAIAGALKVNLTGKLAAARPHQPNLPAYEAFLKGKHQYSKHSVEGYARAEEYFKQAIALDPQWADPHSLLSGLCFNLASMGLRPLREMMPLARAEACNALELSPSEAMAHAALGAIAALHDYDWKEAGEQFRLAMASESLPPYVHLWYSRRYLMPLGRFEEAIQEEEKAITEDPLNPVWRIRQAFTLICAEMYERAIAGAQIALELDERGYEGHLMIALGYFLQGKPAEARAPAEEAFHIAPWDALVVGLLAGVLARAGEKERAEKLMATRPDGLCLYFTLCVEVDAAIDAYERLIEQRHPLAAMVASAGFNKSLRASPRWSRLAKMMNLPESVS